jgi:hypothetical protein
MKHALQTVLLAFLLFFSAFSGGLSRASAAMFCVGDCAGTGTDTITSLVTLVAIALGNEPASSCPHGVPSGAKVDVALIIQAVKNALAGCPAAQATPTPIATTGTPTPTATLHAGVTPCPAGQHRACHSGSGRGGGYKTVCTCVNDPPPVCVTAWGTRIAAGSEVVLYDTLTVLAPDTCAAHGTTVSCDANGVLDPPGATGYAACTVLTEPGGDD